MFVYRPKLETGFDALNGAPLHMTEEMKTKMDTLGAEKKEQATTTLFMQMGDPRGDTAVFSEILQEAISQKLLP